MKKYTTSPTVKPVPLSNAERQRKFRETHPGYGKGTRTSRARNYLRDVNYTDREQRRNAKRHHTVWNHLPSESVILVADGEADDSGHYNVFQVYDGSQFHSIIRPIGQRITFTQAVNFTRAIARKIKTETGKRSHIYFFSFGYDIDQLIGGDDAIPLPQKMRLVKHRSRNFGAVRDPGFVEYETISASKLAVHNGRKTVETRFLKSDLESVWCTVRWHDAFSLSAMSFVKTLEPYIERLPEDSPLREHYERVKTGKAARGAWSESGYDTASITAYNESELLLLHWYISTIIELCKTVGLSPRTLAGPAPLAASLMHKYGVTSHIKPADYDSVGYQRGIENRVCRAAFFGGFIENQIQGRIDTPLYNYDINSAYPWAFTQLPCGAHGYWQHATPFDILAAQDGNVAPYGIWRVEWKIPHKSHFGPFPVRTKHGIIHRPTSGAGWYHTPEIQAAIDIHSAINNVTGYHLTVTDGYIWIPTCEHAHPFAAMMEDTYRERRELKRTGDPAQLPLKLAMNSCYGKMAQTAGSYRMIDENGVTLAYHTPKLSNLMLAGLTTSLVRARMYRAVMTNPAYVVSVMTDGIYSLEPLDISNGDGVLGGWECGQTFDGQDSPIYAISPGVMIRRNHSKIRGVPLTINYERIAEQFSRDNWLSSGGNDRYKDTFMRYIGLQQAAHSESGTVVLDALWGTFAPRDYKLDISPTALLTKRNVMLGGWDNLSERLQRFYPYDKPRIAESGLYMRAIDEDTPSDYPEMRDREIVPDE